MRMGKENTFEKNKNFWFGTFFTILEGILAGCSYGAVYFVMLWIKEGTFHAAHIRMFVEALLLLFAVRFLIYGTGYTKSQIGGASVSKRIRLLLGDKLKKIPLKQFQKGHVGAYVNTMNSDVANYEKILTHNIGTIAKNVTLAATIIAAASAMYQPAGLILCVVGLLLIPNLLLSFRVVKVYGEAKNKVAAETVSGIVEYISGIQTLRVYGMCGEKNKAVTDAMRDYSEVCYRYEQKGIPVGFSYNMISWLSVPVIILLALEPFRSGEMGAVDFMMVAMLPILFIKLTTAISIDLFSYKNLLISKKNISSVMEEKEEQGKKDRLCAEHHDITFENVSFSYEKGEPVLKEVSFHVPEHKLTAVVGDSGSGKSTILNLISGYYEADAGKIRIGDKNIAEYTSEAVLDEISMVDQNVMFFNDSIKDNIRYANQKATDEEIKEACRRANCESFILKEKDGYDTKVGENGNHLSGGERQRLSIARAIVKDSPILLLDEATASLDIENEFAVKTAIANLLLQKKTVVMVAHTLSVIKKADQILVLEDGKIKESGTHEQLLEKNGKYKKMWEAEKKNLSVSGM